MMNVQFIFYKHMGVRLLSEGEAFQTYIVGYNAMCCRLVFVYMANPVCLVPVTSVL